MKQYTDITFKYLKKQKKRTLLSILGIILSVALITSIGTMAISLRDLMIRQAIEFSGDYHAEFKELTGDMVKKITDNIYVKKSAIKGTSLTAYVNKVSEAEKRKDSYMPEYRYLEIESYDKSIYEMFPTEVVEGRLPETLGEIAIEYWMMDCFPQKYKVGDKIKLDIGRRKSDSGDALDFNSWSQDEEFKKTGEKEYTIVGLIKNNRSWVGGFNAKAITFLDKNNLSKGERYCVFTKMSTNKNIRKNAEYIAEHSGMTKIKERDISRYNIDYNESLLRCLGQSRDNQMNLTLILISAFTIVIIIISTIAVIYNVFNISVLERISQFGVLRCTGASPNQIRKIVFKEALILSLIGIPLGLALGIVAMKTVLIIIGSFKYNMFEGLTLTISPLILFISGILGLITIYISAFGPAKQAARISPLEAVRNTGAFKKETLKKVKEPKLLKPFLGVEGLIAFKNLGRNRKRFRITVFSLVISIVLYIFFGSYMSYLFKIGLADTNDNIDFYLYNRTTSESREKDLTVYNELKAIKGVDVIYKSFYSYIDAYVPENKINPKYLEIISDYDIQKDKDGLIRLSSSNINSYGNDAITALKTNLKEGKISIEDLNKENGVILMQTGKFMYGEENKRGIHDVTRYKVGDYIDFKLNEHLNEGTPYVRVKVLGIVEKAPIGDGYNNGGINLYTTEEVFKNITDIEISDRLMITLKKDGNREDVTKYLQELNKNDSNYWFIDRAETVKETRDILTTMSIFLYGFIGIITLIGCLNIANTISTNLILRTKELSILKAVGMSQLSIRKMVFIEGLLYGAYAAVIGGTIGTGLTYIVFRLISRVEEFEWIFPWEQIIVAVLGAMMVTLLSSYLPLKKMDEKNIMDNIRMEE